MSFSLRTHEHTHTLTMSFSLSFFPYTLLTHRHQHTHINTHINTHTSTWYTRLFGFSWNTQTRNVLFLKHTWTHTHIDHDLFLRSFSLHTHTHQHTHINTHPSTHTSTWYTMVIRVMLFSSNTHTWNVLFLTHTWTHTHTHVDHVLFLKSFSLHTPYTLTSTHTHQPDTPGLFGLCSCPETRTHEMSFFLRTHEHTRT